MNVIREEIKEIIKKVNIYLNIGRLDAAEKLLKSSLAEYGSIANIHNLLGVTYHKQSKFPEAIEHFTSAIDANPNFIEAHINLSACYCDLSRYDEAEKIYTSIYRSLDKKTQRPLMLVGRIANSHSETGILYEEAGMYLEAIKEYKLALSLYQPLPDIQIKLANLYLRVENYSEAKNIFDEILNHLPTSTHARVGLGIVYFKSGQKDQARQQWEIAYKNDPNSHIASSYKNISEMWVN